MDALLLHEEIKQVLLLLVHFSEVTQVLQHIKVEIVLDALNHGTFQILV